MKRLFSALAVTLLAGVMISPAFAAPDRVPTTIRDDFETGELCGWESYPYAQDIGYEPFTVPQTPPTTTAIFLRLIQKHLRYR